MAPLSLYKMASLMIKQFLQATVLSLFDQINGKVRYFLELFAAAKLFTGGTAQIHLIFRQANFTKNHSARAEFPSPNSVAWFCQWHAKKILSELGEFFSPDSDRPYNPRPRPGVKSAIEVDYRDIRIIYYLTAAAAIVLYYARLFLHAS